MYPKIHQLIPHRRRPWAKAKEIGIEIEMEGVNLQIPTNDYWTIIGDGSLRGEAIEYFLQAPVPLQNVKRVLTYLNNLLQKEGAVLRPSDRCGVHVHLNMQQNTFQETFNLMFVWLIMEEVFVAYCGESREGNLFCLRAKDAEFLVNRLIECKRYNDITIMTDRGNDIKYSAINPGALSKHGSLEFRSLKTPNDLSDIEIWVKLLYQLKTFALSLKNPADLIEQFSLLDPEEFVRLIMGKYTRKLIQNIKDLDEKLMNGIRLAQDVAYIESVQRQVTLEDLNIKKKKTKREHGVDLDNYFARATATRNTFVEQGQWVTRQWGGNGDGEAINPPQPIENGLPGNLIIEDGPPDEEAPVAEPEEE